MWSVCHQSQTLWSGIPVSFLLPNHKQLIRLKRTPSITHTLIWLTVSFVLPNHKQFIRVKVCCISHTPSSGCPFLLCCLITHSSSQWTVCCVSHTPSSGCPFLLFVLMANSSLNCTVWCASHMQLKSELYLMHPSSQDIFYDFLAPPFEIIASHTVYRRVSDRSVAFGSSCSSVYTYYSTVDRAIHTAY